MGSGWRNNYLRYRTYFLNVTNQYRERGDIKAYLEILLSLITITIFSIFALRPTLLTIGELIKEVETKKETLAKIDSKIQNLSKAQLLYDRQRKNIYILNVAVPARATPEVFTQQLDAIAIKNGIKMTRINLDNGEILKTEIPRDRGSEKNQVQELPFSIEARIDIDDFTKLVSLITDMENSRVITKINQLSLALEEEEEKFNKEIVLTIEGVTPYFYLNNKKPPLF